MQNLQSRGWVNSEVISWSVTVVPMAPVRMNWLPTKNATAKRMMTMTIVVRWVDAGGIGFLGSTGPSTH